MYSRLDDGYSKTVRLKPRLQRVQELAPVTGEVKISEREIQWSMRMYRPQDVAETQSIHRQTLAYQGQTSVQRDEGPDSDELAVSSTCQRIQKFP